VANQVLDRASFLNMAHALGFDREDPHLDELYPWVLTVLEAIAPLDDLQLDGVPPGLGVDPDGEA
jgi:hypothetical protein